MEAKRKPRRGTRYDRRMPLKKAKDPIDAAIRRRVRALNLKQRDLARLVGKTPSWAHKYLNGKGHVTIDDLIRIGAFALDVQGLSESERQMLKLWGRLPPASQADALEWFGDFVRRAVRHGRKRG
jgi:transcriptional regulator with XRE-family HTH domain